MLEKVIVEVIDNQKRVVLPAIMGQNLWEILTNHQINTGGTCAGQGTCGKCKVQVEGKASPREEKERKYMMVEEWNRGVRLACRCTIEGSVKVYIEDNEYLQVNLPLYTDSEKNDFIAQATSYNFFIPGMDKENPVPIHRRLCQALEGKQVQLNPENLNELAHLDRVGRPSLQLSALILDDYYVPCISREEPSAFGVAIDIGTTTLFAALVDLTTGILTGASTQTNMQRVYGADVISRVTYCLEHPDGLEDLQQVLINNINSMIKELLGNCRAKTNDIYRLAVVGNPVMLHLLLGLKVNGFAATPYTGLFIDELQVKPYTCGILAHPSARMYILPQAGGFVGADTIACLLTIADKIDRPFLLIDIGTNGEVVVGNKGSLWTASAAAGPAFEGGNITCGMRAGEGAIDQVNLTEDGSLICHKLGNGPTRGICGSGVVALTAALIEAQYIDHTGTFQAEAQAKLEVREGYKGLELILSKDLPETPVIFNQEDIRQVQLAKAAIRTAVDLLLDKANIDPGELENIFLAGAFGQYLNPEQAALIGLWPNIEISKIHSIGNAAGHGAIMALLNSFYQEKARVIQSRLHCVELASDSQFQPLFMQNLNF